MSSTETVSWLLSSTACNWRRFWYMTLAIVLYCLNIRKLDGRSKRQNLFELNFLSYNWELILSWQILNLVEHLVDIFLRWNWRVVFDMFSIFLAKFQCSILCLLSGKNISIRVINGNFRPDNIMLSLKMELNQSFNCLKCTNGQGNSDLWSLAT